MSDAGWLAVAVVAGALFAVGWVKREMWVRRRRARQGKGAPR